MPKPSNFDEMCRHLTDAILTLTNKKGGTNEFWRIVSCAWTCASAEQAVAIDNIMKSFRSSQCGRTKLALAALIPHERQSANVKVRIRRIQAKQPPPPESHSSPPHSSRTGSQPRDPEDVSCPPDVSACASKRTWWDILGVRPDCSATDVRKAFKECSLRTHPDKGGSAEAFTVMYAAYGEGMRRSHPPPVVPGADDIETWPSSDSDDEPISSLGQT